MPVIVAVMVMAVMIVAVMVVAVMVVAHALPRSVARFGMASVSGRLLYAQRPGTGPESRASMKLAPAWVLEVQFYTPASCPVPQV